MKKKGVALQKLGKCRASRERRELVDGEPVGRSEPELDAVLEKRLALQIFEIGFDAGRTLIRRTAETVAFDPVLESVLELDELELGERAPREMKFSEFPTRFEV